MCKTPYQNSILFQGIVYLFLSTMLFGAGAFKVDSIYVPVGGGEFLLPVRVDNERGIQGFFFALEYDPAGVVADNIVFEDTEAASAEFNEIWIDSVCGSAQVHVIMDWRNPYDNPVIPPGVDQVIALLRARILDGGEEEIFQVRFGVSCVSPSQPISYVVDGGWDVLPDLFAGSVETFFVPEIGEITPSQTNGGEPLLVLGENFTEECVVSVDGEAVEFDLLSSVEIQIQSQVCTERVVKTVSVCRNSFCAEGVYDCRVDSQFVRGDSNGDSRIDIADAIAILCYLFRDCDLECTDSGDVNDDGSVDLSDPIHLLLYFYLSGYDPLPPFPEEGFDQTGDELGCPLKGVAQK